MAPMTKGSNLPYRRLAVELGARVLVSEMAVARRLKQQRNGEFALIRRFEGEPCFGVQLAGTNAEEMAWAAALVESRGADFVDINLGCPIDHFTRKGMGAALGRQPSRVRRIVETMAKAVPRVPVTVKIRLGWNDEMRNHVDARAGGGRWRRAGDLRPRAHAGCAVSPCGRLGRDWRGRRRRAGAGRRQRRPAVPARDRGGARAGGLCRRDDRARRAHQAVDLPRGDRGLSRAIRATSVSRSIGDTWRSRSSTGATTSAAGRTCATSRSGT